MDAEYNWINPDPVGQPKTVKKVHGSRSKKGCAPCRSKKVKCCEVKPTCSRCCRLKLTCSWPPPMIPLRERRRLRRAQLESTSEGSPSSVTFSATPEHSEVVTSDLQRLWEAPSSTPISSYEHSEISINSRTTSHSGSSSPYISNSIDLVLENLQFQNSSDFGIRNLIGAGNDLLSELSSPTIYNFPNVSQYFVPFPESLEANNNQHHALSHYKTTFGFSYSTKCPNWSTLGLLFDIGSRQSMVMHLLLAVSLKDMSWRKNNHEALRLSAQHHYKAGAQLLATTMTVHEDASPIAVLATFWFLYMYKTKWGIDAKVMNRLSETARDYVAKNKLDHKIQHWHLCKNDTNNFKGHDDNQALLSRILIVLYYEDVKYSFYHCGGTLARYLNTDQDRLKKVYDASTTSPLSTWGSNYPRSEIIDDMENSMVLQFLHDLNFVKQEIHDAFTATEPGSPHVTKIKEKLSSLEQTYSSLLNLSTAATEQCSSESSLDTKLQPRLSSNLDIVTANFYATKIYFYRCIISDLRESTPITISESIHSILTISHQIYTSAEIGPYHRIEWSLFIVAIETKDAIYRDWITSKLAASSVITALARILDEQKRRSSRVDISFVRESLY